MVHTWLIERPQDSKQSPPGLHTTDLVHGRSKWSGEGWILARPLLRTNHLRLNLVSWAILKNCPSYNTNNFFNSQKATEFFAIVTAISVHSLFQ